MKTKNYINDFCSSLKELHKAYPSQNMGRHLEAALDGYSLFGISDKELAYAMSKYITSLEIDPIASETEIDKILKDTDKIFNSGFDPYDDEEEDY